MLVNIAGPHVIRGKANIQNGDDDDSSCDSAFNADTNSQTWL